MKSLVAVLAVFLFLAGPAAAGHVDQDSKVSEPFAAAGPLTDNDLPAEAVAGSGLKLRRHGTRGFTSPRWAIDLPGRGRTVVQRKQQNVSSDGRSVTWLGTVEGAEGGLVSVTQRGDVISGFIDDGQRYWVIENAGQGIYKLFEIDTSLTPPPANPLGTGAEPTGDDSGSGGTQPAGTTIIQDVLIVYTPEVTARYGTVAATETAIVNHVAAINQSYSTSQVDIQLYLVGMVQTAQSQSGNMGTTLSRLRSTTDGYYDEVHPLRDQLGADLVAMLTTETRYCGIAYLNYPQFAGEDRYAFSVTSAYSGYACLPLTLGHEVGHNQGLCHNREETGCANPAYIYGYGYLSCGSFRTIMSYSCNPNSSSPTRIYNFANPNVLHSGVPTGIAHSVDPENSSEAFRALNDSALDVAAWRDGCTEVSEPVAPTGLSATAVSSEDISLSWTDVSSNESAFEVERSLDGTTNSWTKTATVGSGGVVYVDGGLDPDTTYYYRLRAINCAGVSLLYTNVASDTTFVPPVLLAVPDGLIAVFDGVDTVDASWNVVTGAVSYDVGRAEKLGKGNNWSAIDTIANVVGGIMYADVLEPAGETYRYYVRSRNASGDLSDWSSHAQVKTSGGGGGGGGGNGCGKGKKKNCGGT